MSFGVPAKIGPYGVEKIYELPAQAGIGQVVEGVLAARAVHEVAARHRVEMPIAEQIYRVLYAGLPPRDAVNALMLRTIKAEKG